MQRGKSGRLPPENTWPVPFDEQLFAELYPYIDNRTLGQVFGLSPSAIGLRGNRYGIAKEFIMRQGRMVPAPNTIIFNEREFETLYATTPNVQLALRYGRSIPWIEKKAHALGLYKSQEHWSTVHLGQQNSLGHVDPPQTRLKKRIARIGHLNPNWKGGIAHTNQSERDSLAMKDWKRAVLARDSYRCCHCGKTGSLHVHHRFAYVLFPTLRTLTWNGMALCHDCHKQVHRKYRKKSWLRLLPVLTLNYIV